MIIALIMTDIRNESKRGFGPGEVFVLIIACTWIIICRCIDRRFTIWRYGKSTHTLWTCIRRCVEIVWFQTRTFRNLEPFLIMWTEKNRRVPYTAYTLCNRAAIPRIMVHMSSTSMDIADTVIHSIIKRNNSLHAHTPIFNDCRNKSNDSCKAN